MQPSSVTFKGVGIPNMQPVLLDSFIVPGFVQHSLSLDPATLWTDPSARELASSATVRGYSFQNDSIQAYRARTVPEVHMVESFNRAVVDGQSVRMSHVIMTLHRGAEQRFSLMRDIGTVVGREEARNKARVTGKRVVSDRAVMGKKSKKAIDHGKMPVATKKTSTVQGKKDVANKSKTAGKNARGMDQSKVKAEVIVQSNRNTIKNLNK
jgi:hypothetical protein